MLLRSFTLFFSILCLQNPKCVCDTYSASQCSLTADGRHLVLLADMCKELQSANRVACDQFISGPFPRKRTELGRVGGERQSFRAKQGGKSKSGCRPRWQVPGQPEAGWPEAQWPRSQERQERPEPPREVKDYIVGGMGEKSYILVNG